MMRKDRTILARALVGATGVAAMLAASATPALARGPGGWGYRGYGYPGGWYGDRYRYRHRHRHYHDGLSAGEVIGIIGVIGAVAVLASKANRDKVANRGADPRYDDRSGDDGRYDDARRDKRDDDYRSDNGSAITENDAVDACVSAARDEAERDGGYAEVVDVEKPRASGGDGWDIQGSLEHRRSYSDTSGRQKNFSCTFERGRVAHVYVTDHVA